MKYIMTKTDFSQEKIGKKALALAKLSYKVENIPKFFVISTDAFLCEQKDDVKAEILNALKDFSDDTLFAVRSSALDEDGVKNSYAGQFDTYLNVKKTDIYENVEKVWNSSNSLHIDAYRKERGIKDVNVPAVIVQEMIDAQFAGVAFKANILNGNTKECLISAVCGLGDKLVDGSENSSDYVLSFGKVLKKPEQDILSEEILLEIERLTKVTSKYFKQFQDIEWAYKDGKVYLLQSRPITTLRLVSHKDDFVNLWDNSNIAESYNGVTTPLTASFIRLAYEHVYREMCRIFGVSEEKLEKHDGIFKNMLGFLDGQVYYNMLSWYKLIAILPGYKTNRSFMEGMMGVKEPIPSYMEKLLPISEESKFKDKINLFKGGFGLIKQFRKVTKNTEAFYVLLNETLSKKDIKEMSIYELLDYYKRLESKLLKKWNAPVLNDFFAMMFYGILKSISKKWCNEEDENRFNALLQDTGDIISAEPAKLVAKMAEILKDDDEMIEIMLNEHFEVIDYKLNGEILKEVTNYLDKFGDRCINELKLESVTLNDDPTNLYRAIANYALKLKNDENKNITGEIYKSDIESEMTKKLSFVKKIIFKFICKHTRILIKNRENMRFERTRVFGVVRSIVKEIGEHFVSFDVISNVDDIFYLELYEILGFIDGTGTTKNLKGIIDVRRLEYASFEGKIPNRFETFGAVNLSEKHIKENKNIEEFSDVITGLGCSPGIVRGRARVVYDPSDAKLLKGEILVAQRTDPGWIMLFPVASAVLVEYGSLLSHAAIVVREMSIPAVVSVRNLFEFINDGDIIEIDGSKGTVRKIGETDEE